MLEQIGEENPYKETYCESSYMSKYNYTKIFGNIHIYTETIAGKKQKVYILIPLRYKKYVFTRKENI